MEGRAALHHSDVVHLLEDGGDGLVTGPSDGEPGQLARERREEGDDDGEGKDPPAASEQPGGVSQRPIGGAPGTAGGQVPGRVPD